MYCIWLDEARAREQLAAARAVHDLIALGNGAREHELPDWEDPADAWAAAGPGEGSRTADPAARAAQVQAFVAAAGGEAG